MALIGEVPVMRSSSHTGYDSTSVIQDGTLHAHGSDITDITTGKIGMQVIQR